MKRIRAIRERLPRRRAARVVRTGGPAGGGGFFVQYWAGRYHASNLTLANVALLAVVLVVAAVVMQVLSILVPRGRAALRARRRRRRRLLAQGTIERRARVEMSELCPDGWRAQITLFADDDAAAPVGRGGERARVALDWAELKVQSGSPAVVRRVWAPTIAEALEAMVADRRTDETLERIEHGAAADGALWPDLYL